MKLLKQNFLNLAFVNSFAIKKVLNILLYNKILVRTFDVKSSKKNVSVVKRSTMLKIIADNYINFFLFSEKKVPKPYMDFINANKKSFNKDLQLLTNVDHLYSFKILKNQAANTGFSYKVKNLYINNYDQRYSKLLHKHIAYTTAKTTYLQDLKNKIDSFLTLSKIVSVVLLLSPRRGGYNSYNRGFLGVVGFKQLKFFIAKKKQNFSLQKFKVYTTLQCKIVHGEVFKFLFYFQTKMFSANKVFFFQSLKLVKKSLQRAMFKELKIRDEKKKKSNRLIRSLNHFQKLKNSLTIETILKSQYFK